MSRIAAAVWETHAGASAGHRGVHPLRFAVGLAISAGGAAVLLAEVLQRIATSG